MKIFKNKFPKENIYYENKNGILYKGDCLKILEKFPDETFDLILTDPPYGTTMCKWDTVINFDEMWKLIKKIRKDNTAILIFGDEPFSSCLRMSNIREYKYDLIWKKQSPVNFFQLKRRFGKVTEFISVFYKKQCTFNPQKIRVHNNPPKYINNPKKGKKRNSLVAGSNNKDIPRYLDDGTRFPINILEFKRVDKYKLLHPTQKPIELLEYLIKTYTNEKDLVLDFTCGSGSTLIAAQNLNRRWIGIELEEEYCRISKERLESKLIKTL